MNQISKDQHLFVHDLLQAEIPDFDTHYNLFKRAWFEFREISDFNYELLKSFKKHF